jgi:hypothetical protein
MQLVSDLPALTPAYKGAYLFDPTGQSQPYAVSSIKGILSEIVLIGSNDRAISVTSTDIIPDQGYFVVSFDGEKREGPIRYNSRTQISPTEYLINIDPSFTFKNTHLVGENINVIRQLTPFIPKSDGSLLQAYVTGIKATRDFVVSLIEKNVAAGVFVEVDLKVPDLTYEDPSLKIYE